MMDDKNLLLEPYLAESEFIDWKHVLVVAKAAELAGACTSDETVAKRCFEFVRDDIKHSWDFRMNPLTCKASEILIYGTGYCYAKSHLLAALLRANGIPAGLCYQRLAGSQNRQGDVLAEEVRLRLGSISYRIIIKAYASHHVLLFQFLRTKLIAMLNPLVLMFNKSLS